MRPPTTGRPSSGHRPKQGGARFKIFTSGLWNVPTDCRCRERGMIQPQRRRGAEKRQRERVRSPMQFQFKLTRRWMPTYGRHGKSQHAGGVHLAGKMGLSAPRSAYRARRSRSTSLAFHPTISIEIVLMQVRRRATRCPPPHSRHSLSVCLFLRASAPLRLCG